MRLILLLFALPIEHSLIAEGVLAQRDSLLFRAAVASMMDSSEVLGELRVDPRPLANDPRIVTLHLSGVLTDIATVGTGVPTAAWSDTTTSHDIQRRLEALRTLKVTRTDAIEDAKCPGVLIPPSPAIEERKRATCPSAPYRSVILSTPREGGAYWPNEVDERVKYQGRNVASLRLIVRSLSPHGSVESAWDFVFEWQSDGVPRLLEKRLLLILE